MPQPEQFEVLILGSGQGGKLLAWHMARSGRRTAVVERRWIGGSCPNIACLPSKNEVWSAKVAHLVHHAAQFGMTTGPVAIDLATGPAITIPGFPQQRGVLGIDADALDVALESQGDGARRDRVGKADQQHVIGLGNFVEAEERCLCQQRFGMVAHLFLAQRR